jgi:hypothetical protein
MSADNGYLVRQRPNGKWVAQHYFLSAEYPDIMAVSEQDAHSSFERIIQLYSDAANETEYGFKIIYSEDIEKDPIIKDGEEQLRILGVPNRLIATPEVVEFHNGMEIPDAPLEHTTENTIPKVYDALRECGIHGQLASDIVMTIHNKGILFRERT